jgi:hypothetical protein
MPSPKGVFTHNLRLTVFDNRLDVEGYYIREEEEANMSIRFIIRIGIVSALLGAVGCAPVVAPLPPAVRRIAVLPPYKVGTAETHTASGVSNRGGLLEMTVGDVLAQQARARLAEKGYSVIPHSVVKLATNDRAPTSPQMAAQMLEEAHVDAAALYIEVRRWEPTPNPRGMKADGVIVALDVTMIDPKAGAVLWQVHRASRPVPLYGVVLTGHAHVFVAETVMREVFASLESKRAGG